MIRVALLLALLPAVVQAAALRYNGPPPPEGVRPPICKSVEGMVRRRTGAVVDTRLIEAAHAILAHMKAGGRPSNDLVQAALWQSGIIDPPPQLIIAQMSEGADAEMLAEIERQLATLAKDGGLRAARWRVGVGARAGSDAQTWVLVALEESNIAIGPIARALPAGGEAVVEGRLTGVHREPTAFVTAPSGQVTPLRLAGDAIRFRGDFRCGAQAGRYQLELTAKDAYGASVLANFPVYCGVPAPHDLHEVASEEAPLVDGAQAEREMLALVNADRARAKLPPLFLDARLSEVARAHSVDMREHKFVGHISPTTGGASDRLRHARLGAQLVLENVARAFSSGEAERGLMASPGHRANILNPAVNTIGIGAALADAVGGGKELLVTQVFVRPLDPADDRTAAAMGEALQRHRREQRLPQLVFDRELARVATLAVDAVLQTGDAARADGPVDSAAAGLSSRFGSIARVVVRGGSAEQLVRGITRSLKPDVSHWGMQLREERRSDGTIDLVAVILFASAR